ncbi:unnamed protein product [Rotaria sordida]|nr:unnamed protein product [Rotaria sordida]
MSLIDDFPHGNKCITVYCINDQKLKLRLAMQFTKEKFLILIEEDCKDGLSKLVPIPINKHLKEKSNDLHDRISIIKIYDKKLKEIIQHKENRTVEEEPVKEPVEEEPVKEEQTEHVKNQISETFKSLQTLSFDSISAFGSNAAIIHYSPKPKTAATITKNGTYLLDAGAQYLDCTTDVTRTHVFGIPTEEQKKAYTLVLQGSTDLADAVFPFGTYGRSIDILTRQYLFKNFMNYNHGTGHGIGHYLSVHEGPSFISMGYSSNDIPLTDGMVFSDEPGFYLPRQFGIRLETDIIVKNYTLTNNYGNSTIQFLHFEILTLVPFERNLIICEMLTENQKIWLNWYHTEVRNKLENTNRLNQDELHYLRDKTQEIKC